jgi:hypothetical protein
MIVNPDCYDACEIGCYGQISYPNGCLSPRVSEIPLGILDVERKYGIGDRGEHVIPRV